MSAVYANLSVMLGIFFQNDGECRQVRPCHNGRRPNVRGEGSKTGGLSALSIGTGKCLPSLYL